MALLALGSSYLCFRQPGKAGSRNRHECFEEDALDNIFTSLAAGGTPQESEPDHQAVSAERLGGRVITLSKDMWRDRRRCCSCSVRRRIVVPTYLLVQEACKHGGITKAMTCNVRFRGPMAAHDKRVFVEQTFSRVSDSMDQKLDL